VQLEPVTHSIEEDLVCGWLDDCVRRGQRELEVYLAKQAAFDAFLATR